jgi:hypothetical protein
MLKVYWNCIWGPDQQGVIIAANDHEFLNWRKFILFKGKNFEFSMHDWLGEYDYFTL